MQPYRFPLKFGKYLLTRRLAVGGMAEVFKAKIVGIKGFEKTVAVKKILPEFNEDEDFVQMFVDEARISSYLNHNNIVHVFDFGVAEGSYYIAMEYVDGPNLKNFIQRLLKQKGSIPRNLALYIVSQIARGLEYAHTVRIEGQDVLNLVHRDISPQNILVSRTGEVKITDFGIAKAAIKLSRTQPGKIQGKFSYMSPEQAAGKSLDRRSDIFSLGIITYELLTGTKLYASEDTHKRYAEVREARFPRIGQVLPDLPAQIESLVTRMLEREPNDRPQSAAEILSELGEFLSNISIQEITNQLGSLVDDIFPREASDSDAHHRIEGIDGNFPPSSKKEEVDAEPREITKSIDEEPTVRGGPPVSLPLAIMALLVSLSAVAALIFYLTRTPPAPHVVVSATPTPESPAGEESTSDSTPRAGPIDSDLRAAAQAREAEVKAKMRNLEEQLAETEQKAEEAAIKLKSAEEKLKTVKVEAHHGPCPDDMILIRQGNFLFGSERSDSDRNDLVEPEAHSIFLHKFCVDQFEFPNIRGKTPKVALNWNESQAACAKDGKRLCSQEEWERACKGAPQAKVNLRYPYGTRYDRKACNTENGNNEKEALKLVPAGSMERCHSDEGVFDASGNVDEWTSGLGQFSEQSHVTRGGSKLRPGWASRCTSIRELADDSKESDVGFRCCKDAL